MQTVFITGASSGFGRACAELFASKGFRLIINARRVDRLEALAGEMQQKFDTPVFILPFDVSIERDVFKAVDAIPERFMPIDVLINNAGLALGRDYFYEADLQDWNRMVDTNIKGAMYVAQAVAKKMIAHGGRACNGHIINMGSVAAKNQYEKGNIYCATKAAVDAMSKAMRIDLLSKKIKVTAIHPGAAVTEFSLVRFKGDEQQANEVYQGFQPLSAMDVAEVVHYCATLPTHVCINDLTLTPLQQADGIYFYKE